MNLEQIKSRFLYYRGRFLDWALALILKWRGQHELSRLAIATKPKSEREKIVFQSLSFTDDTFTIGVL